MPRANYARVPHSPLWPSAPLLGIGANTAFFGVLNATLFRSLPYPQPDRLVHISESPLKSGGEMPVSYPNFVD